MKYVKSNIFNLNKNFFFVEGVQPCLAKPNDVKVYFCKCYQLINLWWQWLDIGWEHFECVWLCVYVYGGVVVVVVVMVVVVVGVMVVGVVVGVVVVAVVIYDYYDYYGIVVIE